MKHHILTLVIVLLAAAAVSAQHRAETPGVISYQGVISSQNGLAPADGEYPITVTLYADAAGTVRVWQDTYITSVRGGVFNISLGSGNIPLPAPGQMDKALWIGTRIAGGQEMRPLARLGASPYAINVLDGAVTTAKLADGAVTEEKVNLEYIAGVRVNGKKIAIDGRVLNIQAGKDIEILYDEVTQSLIIGSPASAGAGGEKGKDRGREVQGGPQDAWSMEGDGVDPSGGSPVAPDPTDFIGTTTFVPNVPFTVKVNGERVMFYQPNGVLTPSIIGGYYNNTAAAAGDGNIIAGGGTAGFPNTIDGITCNVISGGTNNSILDPGSGFGVIGGGVENEIGTAAAPVNYGTIGGGQANVVTSNHGAIGGGRDNTIGAGGSTSSIAGGESNFIDGLNSVIGGGISNQIASTGHYAMIGGGGINVINGPFGFIGGGADNSILNAGSSSGTIAGGVSNQIGTGAAPVNYATIGGGYNNRITDNGIGAAIPGGDELIAQSYGQAVVGVRNIPKGTIVPGSTPNDEPIFIVGNGIPGNRSNAFEVSYNGHSTVFQTQGSGGPPVVYGGTYADNVTVAWGNVDPNGGVMDDFGVANITQLGTGWYQIDLNVVDPDGIPMQINRGVVTATVTNTDPPGSGNFRCAIINVSQIRNNQFDVYISGPGCTPIDEGFNFKVTVRQ